MRRSSQLETNLARDESFWKEQRRRLIKGKHFGTAARQLLQTGIITSSPKRPNQTKKHKTKLDRKINTIRKRKKQAEKELAEVTDELRDKKTPTKRKKKRNLVITIDSIKRNVTAVKEELKSKEDPTFDSTNAQSDSKQTVLSSQRGEYFEYVESCKKTIKEEEPTTSEEDDITDRDTSQEEEEEGQIDTQNQATMVAFKLKIQCPFIELYLKFKEAHSQSPSPDEVDEALIQIAQLGVDSLEELLGIVEELWKESNSNLTSSDSKTVMEKLIRKFTVIPFLESSYHLSLIVDVLSFELKGSMPPSQTLTQSPITQTPKSPMTQPPSSPITQTHSSPGSPITLSPSNLITQPPSSPFTQTPSSPTTQTPVSPRSPITQHARSPISRTPSCPTTKTPSSPITLPPSNPIKPPPSGPTTQTLSSPTTQTPTTQSPSSANTLTQANFITQANTMTRANHSVEGFFKCTLCDLAFRTETELKTHKIKPHRYNLSKKKFFVTRQAKGEFYLPMSTLCGLNSLQ